MPLIRCVRPRVCIQEVFQINKREQLQDKFEDTVFALLMDDYAVSEGEKALQENERLKRDPTAAVPEKTRKRCEKTIQMYYAAKNARTAGRTTVKTLRRVAVAGFAATLLFVSALAISPDFRIDTLNVVIEIFEDRTIIQAEPGDLSMPSSVEAVWLPEGYALESFDPGRAFSEVLYKTDSGKEIQINISSLNSSKAVDSEGAEIGMFMINDIEAVSISKQGIDGYGNPYELNRVIWLDPVNECYIDIVSYQEDIETLVQVARSLVVK